MDNFDCSELRAHDLLASFVSFLFYDALAGDFAVGYAAENVLQKNSFDTIYFVLPLAFSASVISRLFPSRCTSQNPQLLMSKRHFASSNARMKSLRLPAT